MFDQEWDILTYEMSVPVSVELISNFKHEVLKKDNELEKILIRVCFNEVKVCEELTFRDKTLYVIYCDITYKGDSDEEDCILNVCTI
jgi:hypothetical protein